MDVHESGILIPRFLSSGVFLYNFAGDDADDDLLFGVFLRGDLDLDLDRVLLFVGGGGGQCRIYFLL